MKRWLFGISKSRQTIGWNLPLDTPVLRPAYSDDFQTFILPPFRPRTPDRKPFPLIHSTPPLAIRAVIDYRHGMTWDDTFLALFDRCVATYRTGNHDFESYYAASDLDFLRKIGCQTREFFDFVEDFCEDKAPSPSTALLVAAVRRDYFLTVQKGVPCGDRPLTRDDVPTFGEELDGMAYLPRILAKARAKLRGTLDPDLMFGCGGDRNFLRKHGHIHPADFLRQVWATGDDEQRLSAWVAAQMA